MRRFLSTPSFLACLLAAVVATPVTTKAQLMLTGVGGANGGGPVTYTGPNDIVTPWSVWYGVRAFSSATRGNALVNVCAVGGTSCADLSSSSTTGNLVFANVGGFPCTASVVSGTYNSSTGAVSLTISTSVGLGNDNGFALSSMTGTNAAATFNITSNSFPIPTTSGPGGTTVNFTAATGLTLTITGGTISVCSVKTWYDQSGNSLNATQATYLSEGLLVANCVGSLPCVTGPINSGANPGYALAAPIGTAIPQPFSMSFVGLSETFGFTNTNKAFIDADDATSTFNALATVAANAWEAGTLAGSIAGTASDQALHAANGVFNSTSSVLNIDGTETTGSLGTTGIASTDTVHFLSDGYNDTLFGLGNEGGILPSGMSPTVRTNLCHNQHLYWGTPTSC